MLSLLHLIASYHFVTFLSRN